MDAGPRPRRPDRHDRPGAAPRRAAGRAARLILPLCLAAAAGGCAGTARQGCDADFDRLYAAARDSLAIDPFLRLDAAGQAARRATAAGAAREAGRAKDPLGRVEWAATAAAAAPDDPDLWLAAAAAWRAVGDQYQAAAALGGAAAAVRRLNDPAAPLAANGVGYRRAAALATALARAWHHYERAEWNDADDWARMALQLEPAHETALLVRGLIQGRLGQESRVRQIADDLDRLDVFNPYERWIMASFDESQDRPRGALGRYLDLQPEPEDALVCYRDMGALAERLGEWILSDRWYAQSAAASPLAGGPCLERKVLPRLEPEAAGRPAHESPVWLALGRHYVTGSLSAYTRFACGQFEAAPPGPGRELWAGLAVNAAGIHLRQRPGDPWTLRARGLVFAATGKEDLARDDLRRASAAYAAAGLPGDARVEAELGRLLLGRDDATGAAARLRRAVGLDPTAAAAWGDLGMALAKLGDRGGALAALDRAVELAPDRPAPWYNRGVLHLSEQRLDEAERDLGRAAELAPDNADIARLLQQIRQAKSRAQVPGAKP